VGAERSVRFRLAGFCKAEKKRAITEGRKVGGWEEVVSLLVHEKKR